MVETTETTRKLEPVWRCQAKGCNHSYPSTLHGFNQMSGHQLHHAKEGLSKEERVFRLIDQNTGEVLAETLKEATGKGLLKLTPEPSPTPTPKVVGKVETIPPVQELGKEPPPLKVKPVTEKPPGEKLPEGIPAEEETTKAEITTVKTAGIFTYEITLPADAFTLFNLAKACGLEPNGDKLFDEWVWDCIRARFSKDYKQQLILAPVEE